MFEVSYQGRMIHFDHWTQVRKWAQHTMRGKSFVFRRITSEWSGQEWLVKVGEDGSYAKERKH